MVRLNFKTIAKRDTEQSADSVEWCPHDGCQHIFVCGTYQLEQDEVMSMASRKGTIQLHQYDAGAQNALTLLQKVQRTAVLDQKWNPVYTDRLAVAGADGMIDVYRLDVSAQPKLELQISVSLQTVKKNERSLALSLGWSSNGRRLLVSDSDGCVELFSFDVDDLQTIRSWKGHGFEAWTCAFSLHNENVVFSGGDDSFLCLHDIRCPNEPVLRNKNKIHTAGVTSLLSLSNRDHALLTGSYDESIRFFDERQFNLSVTEYGLNGGVWRLRSNSRQTPERILCACMYQNFAVVELMRNDTFELIGEYSEHDSICYGCDWRIENGGNVANIIATCSFYDHKLCVAEVFETR